MTDTYAGNVSGMYALDLGDKLSAAAASGATTLTVYDAGDFDEDGGYILINDAVLRYATWDDDDNTITLTDPLPAAAAVDDVVTLWDQANGQPVTIYKAVVDQVDGFDGNAIEAIVPQSLVHALSTTMRDSTGESVVLERDDDGELTVTAISGRAFALAGLQYLQGGMTTRQSDDEPGVDILGTDSGQPGVYVYGSNGNMIVLRDDGSEGLIEFHTGTAGETPGFINPGIGVGGQHVLAFQTSRGASSPTDKFAYMALLGSNGTSTDPTLFLSATNLQVEDVTGIGGDILATGTITSQGTGQFNKVLVLNPDPSTNPVNVVYEGANNQLRKSSSLSRYKLEQQDLTLEDAQAVLRLTPRTWFDRAEVEQNGDSTEGLRRVPGLVAEDVEQHAPVLASYDASGELQGVAYDRVAAVLLPIVRDLVERVECLERRRK
jgi:hypothetical protein